MPKFRGRSFSRISKEGLISANLVGDQELARKLEKLNKKALLRFLQEHAVKGAEVIAKEAAKLAPVDAEQQAEHGDKRYPRGKYRLTLSKSIRALPTSPGRAGALAKVICRRVQPYSAGHAHLLEFGTRTVPRQSFMGPAMRNKRADAFSVIAGSAAANFDGWMDYYLSQNYVILEG